MLGTKVLLIGQRADKSAASLFLELPAIPSDWQFIVDIMPIQIAAERLAGRAGRDCDSFRLCSYIVTYEGGLSLGSVQRQGSASGGKR
jgi:glucosamine 6-phosphate synthetase-like amidotransferase/phosphosugar isomerase protein